VIGVAEKPLCLLLYVAQCTQEHAGVIKVLHRLERHTKSLPFIVPNLLMPYLSRSRYP
jgi:hypothetical protein